MWTLLFLAHKCTHKHANQSPSFILRALLSRRFLPLFPFSSSLLVPPSVIYYFSLFGLLPGLERLPWRQKQIWCRDEKWIIQSEGAMSVCVRVTQCWRVFFAGFNNSWLAIILLIEYLIWIRACVCVRVWVRVLVCGRAPVILCPQFEMTSHFIFGTKPTTCGLPPFVCRCIVFR